MKNSLRNLVFSYGLLIALCTCEALSQEYRYEVDGKSYVLHVTPADQETAEAIKRYRLQTLETSLGSMLSAENLAITETDFRPIVTGTKIYLRSGYTSLTDAEFHILLEKASANFKDLKGIPWDTVKAGLLRRDWARPILKDGEFVERQFFLHNTIIAYWGDIDEKDSK